MSFVLTASISARSHHATACHYKWRIDHMYSIGAANPV